MYQHHSPRFLFYSLFLFCTITTNGQTRLGPVAGLYWNAHSFGNGITYSDPSSPIFTSNTTLGSLFGLRLQHFIGHSFSISTTIAYNNLSGSSQVAQYNPESAVFTVEEPNSTNGVVKRLITHHYEISYHSLSLEAAGQWPHRC